MESLRAICEAYLRSVGFTTYPIDNKGDYWAHPELGGGRTFEQVLSWQMGRERAAVQRGVAC